MSYINIKNGAKYFDDKLIFHNIELSINKPGLYFITGESGCGKSTLLNIIAGFEKLSEGSISRCGTMAMIFQNYELIKELSVIENIFFRNKKSINDEEMDIVNKLGIDTFRNRTINELSFGQRQRIGIARALGQKPDIVLCDEPTESLDVSNKEIVMDTLKEYGKNHIVIIVSHDVELTNKYSEDIYTFKNNTLNHIKTFDNDKEFIKEKSIKLSIFKMVFKMISRKTLSISLIICLLLTAMWSLYSFKKQLFEIPSTNYTISADYIYIKSNKDIYDVMKEYSNDVVQIFDIPSLVVNDEYMRMDILPYHQNDKMDIDGEINNGLIINQNVNANIGDKVVLEIQSPRGVFNYETIVSAVVYERDSVFKSAYYNLDELNEYFQNYEIEEYNSYGFYTNMYDLFLDNPSLYELYVGYDNIDNYDKNKEVSNPLYDFRHIYHEDAGVFGIIYNAVLIIFLIFTIGLIHIYNRFDVDSFIYQVAIMNSVEIRIAKLKRFYLLIKYLAVYISLLFTILLSYLISNYVFYSVTYSLNEYIIAFGLIIFIFIYYIFDILILLNKLKKDYVAMIIKSHESE